MATTQRSTRSSLSRFRFNGANRLALVFFLSGVAALAAQDRGFQPEDQPAVGAYLPGRYYALVIGIDAYHAPIPQLKTAVYDARAVGKLLAEKYGFQVKLLLDQDATRFNILNTLTSYENALDVNDNLLIYYAGHGYSDTTAGKAYWIPIDAESISSPNRISADDLTTAMRDMHSRHILVISDSCYSGDMSQDRSLKDNNTSSEPTVIRRMLEKPSRTLMASGGDEPVSDAGGNGHSVFAEGLLDALRSDSKTEFTATSLFYDEVQPEVAGKSPQTPRYDPIQNSNHGGGDFVFIRSGKVPADSAAPKPAPAPQPAEQPAALNPAPPAEPRTAAPVSSDRPEEESVAGGAEALAGDYDFGTIIFTIRPNADGSLSAITAGSAPIELDRTTAPLQFTVKVAPGVLDEFHRSANGSIDELLVHQPTGLGIGVRVAGNNLGQAALNSYVGTYQVGAVTISIGELANGVMTYAVTGQPAVDMRLAHGSWFVLVGVNSVSVEFVPGPNGKPAGFNLHLPTGDTFVPRVN